jgi:hypothetical protein
LGENGFQVPLASRQMKNNFGGLFFPKQPKMDHFSPFNLELTGPHVGIGKINNFTSGVLGVTPGFDEGGFLGPTY